MHGIVVSNHGVRQQDGGCSSLGMLPRIVEAVGDTLEVIFDSGIRTGPSERAILPKKSGVVVVEMGVCRGWGSGGVGTSRGRLQEQTHMSLDTQPASRYGSSQLDIRVKRAERG